MNQEWVRVIRQAENAFWTIIFSARKRIGDRGVLLPDRFQSRAKIERFLRKHMTDCLADRVIRNLQLRTIRGRLAIPVGDGIGAPPILSVKLLSQAKGTVTLAVWFGFDREDRFFRVYQLRRNVKGRWIIYGRHPLDYPFNLYFRRQSSGCCSSCNRRPKRQAK
ncbi:IseA DL-endopeptidase inhibitor family protein [Brevibacillus ruminantium]|uniref:IseA DL-endopeptidase inhibitor family protein n=1 Tax=Brevibacillus ruminantium TaxID=2950604 RepID=A0ABY4WIT3_9BACL|nr:IseA DL-endopeptidase inhibitor family protein [Brevibacillus ruminantium]USG67017.1 IseA DL-endopeptidase inhibitor family protein [Brevibacillus ruminantium]